MTRIFFTKCERYLYNLENALSLEEVGEILESAKKSDKIIVHLPVVIDTEFQTWSEKHKELLASKNLGSLTITSQIKSIVHTDGLIFCHWDMSKYPEIEKHFTLQSKNTNHLVEDYLKALGIECELKRANDKASTEYLKKLRRKRNFRIVLFAHYAVADFLRVANGNLKTDLENMMIAPVQNSKITQKRRLRTEYSANNFSMDWVRCNWYMTLGGLDYGLQISVQDTCALHGVSSLSGLAANTGTVMDFKEIYTSDEKSDMLTNYQIDPKSFKQYGLGDLEVYKILENNSVKFRLIWEALGVADYFQSPALTIGSTVSKIFEAKIAKLFENVYQAKLDDKQLSEILATYTECGSSEVLIQREDSTRGLLAKALGGRCFNNRSLDTVHTGVLCDIDISGCYGEGLRGQLYPLGRPVIIDFPKLPKTNDNGYLSLREFLKKYRKELVAGLWQLWFSVTDDRSNALNPKPLELVSPQDFFASYTPPKKWCENLADTEKEEVSDPKTWLELPDSTKIYSHQITNAVLTHDGLQWLENICSRPLRNQILDNSIVICAEFYPASHRCGSVEELVEFVADHKAVNTSEMVDDSAGEVVSTDRECKKWFAIPLGGFMVDTLLLERKKHPKKTPLNTLFKLCCNTLYGVMVSKYFRISNSCVGQNVTARARLMAWVMEKGFHGHQSITDGCVFDLNHVCYGGRGRKINDSNATSTNRFSNRELTRKEIEFKAISDYVKIQWADNHIETLSFTDTRLWEVRDFKKEVDKIALQHLKNQFSGLDILHAKTTDIYGFERDSVFVFETKGIVKSGVFHGSGNYYLAGGQHDSYGSSKEMIAFRSYEKKLSASPVNFCKQLLANPSAIDRQNPFTKQTMVKVGDFSQRHNSFYRDQVFKPGDTVFSGGWLRECSLSQFLFKNASQRDDWERESAYLKEKLGQSYEVWFTDPQTGKLNYQAMITAIDIAIRQGFKTFKSFIDKSKNNPYKALGPHPSFDEYTQLKERYQIEGLINTDLECDDDWLHSEDYQDYETEGTFVTEDIDW